MFECLGSISKDVKVHNNKRSHWTTSGVLGGSVEWDADIIEARENELIAWASVESADVDNSGSVRFQPAPARGTSVVNKMSIEQNKKRC